MTLHVMVAGRDLICLGSNSPQGDSINGTSLVVGMKIISFIHSRTYTKLLHGFSHVSTTCVGRLSDVHPTAPLNAACSVNVVLPNRLGSEPSILYSRTRISRSTFFSSSVGV